MLHRDASYPGAVVGMGVSAAGAAYTTLANATSSAFSGVSPSTFVAWAGAAIAVVFGGVIPKALDAYKAYREVLREQGSLDVAAIQKTLADLYAQINSLQDANEEKDAKLREIEEAYAKFRRKAGKVITETAAKADAAEVTVQAVADRVTAVEAAQGSTSDLHLPTTPPE